MAKDKKVYICNSCGNESPTWAGKCPNCGEWNTLEESIIASSGPIGTSKRKNSSLTTSDLASAYKNIEERLSTGEKDIDQVLGGGLVKGSVILLAGEPGVGKSTLLLQIADGVSKSAEVLYLSAEESTHQVALRAKRLGADSKSLSLSDERSVDDIVPVIRSGKYDFIVIDSIQTVYTEGVSSNPGSISQINSCSHMLIDAAKQSKTCLIIVGHVTKEGNIAGPKLLEHIVDVVLQLEGDKQGVFKVLRGNKNRFGGTDEVAILDMKTSGLKVVSNPSKVLLDERKITDGSIVFAAMEGSRPILVEIQALVNKSPFGYPKRTVSGLDLNRLNLLVAVLEKRTKLNLSDKDIFVNVVGGLKITENAVDLAICMAIGSAAKGLKLSKNSVVFGEVGLSGEVRHVPNIERRIKEASKMGFEMTIGPSLSSAPTNHYKAEDVRSTLLKFLKS